MIRAITRAISRSLADCELTYFAREAIDLSRAAAQHADYCEALRRAGATVETLAAADHLPDATFVEDTAIVLDALAIITRPGAASRRDEVHTVAAALQASRPLRNI